MSKNFLMSDSTVSSSASLYKKAQSKESKQSSKIDQFDFQDQGYEMHNQFQQTPQRLTTIQPLKVINEQEQYNQNKGRQTLMPSYTHGLSSQVENISLCTQKKTKPNEETQLPINQENDAQYGDSNCFEGNVESGNFQSE